MDLLLSLNRARGMTLIVSLHDVSVARRYCERVVALRDGVLVYDGPSAALTPSFLRELYGTVADELRREEEPHERAADRAMETTTATTAT
jgi:phosphonate transport system ATP-binding protein